MICWTPANPLFFNTSAQAPSSRGNILTILSWPGADFDGADFEGDKSTDYGSEYDGFDDPEEEEWRRDVESEDLDREQNIEEHEYTISGDTAQTVKIQLFLTDEGMDQSRWMKTFVTECTCNDAAVAIALAQYIHREGMRFEFWEKMEVLSSEMCDVAF
ncbi:uncharacterized protein Aud_000123 [Aspergillus udagawae]|uniref:Uncharacterized protein n=1 Tax=Aspergillus udagawae TaxID=91492 RepID=A0A8E0QKI3_9EURO|nr:uncharacterized protein Aud_000123 [Aspergillus udagawae]GIC84308.1 hypothetical protein Aud_000123 [Aspergillus udagawae]